VVLSSAYSIRALVHLVSPERIPHPVLRLLTRLRLVPPKPGAPENNPTPRPERYSPANITSPDNGSTEGAVVGLDCKERA
jgi:hypothetical protein